MLKCGSPPKPPDTGGCVTGGSGGVVGSCVVGCSEVATIPVKRMIIIYFQVPIIGYYVTKIIIILVPHHYWLPPMSHVQYYNS